MAEEDQLVEPSVITAVSSSVQHRTIRVDEERNSLLENFLLPEHELTNYLINRIKTSCYLQYCVIKGRRQNFVHQPQSFVWVPLDIAQLVLVFLQGQWAESQQSNTQMCPIINEWTVMIHR